MAIRKSHRAVMLCSVAAGALFIATGNVEAQCQRNGQTGTQTSTTGTSSSTATNTATARRQVGLLRQQQQLQTGLQRQQQQVQLQQQQQQIALLQQQLLQQQALIQTLQQQQQPTSQQTTQQQPTNTAQIERQPARQPQFQRIALNQSPDALAPVVKDPPTPQDPEDLAGRQLSIARQLTNDAKTARLEGKYEVASTLASRAEERLQNIINKYSGTLAADRAEEMLKKIQ